MSGTKILQVAWLGRLGMSKIMFESEGPWIMVYIQFTLVLV